MSLSETRPILIVEDSDEDYEAALWAFRKASLCIPIVRCINGEEAIDYLQQSGDPAHPRHHHRPAIVLLDLNMPRSDGRQVLSYIKNSAQMKSLPVIVLTTSANPKDVYTCYERGANCYLVKPVGLDKLNALVQMTVDYWLRTVLLPQPQGGAR